MENYLGIELNLEMKLIGSTWKKLVFFNSIFYYIWLVGNIYINYLTMSKVQWNI